MAYIGCDGEYVAEVGDGGEIYEESFRLRESRKPRGHAEGWDALLNELKKEKKIVAPKKLETKSKKK